MAFQGRGIDGAHKFYDLLSSSFSFQPGSHIAAVLVKSGFRVWYTRPNSGHCTLSFATSVYLTDLIDLISS